jgi:hypothetical protein
VSNGKKTGVGATIAVMTIVIAGFLVSIVRGSKDTSKELVKHVLSIESHPSMNEKIDTITHSVEKIAGNMETMMIRQEVQTVMMEHMSEDISELKDDG